MERRPYHRQSGHVGDHHDLPLDFNDALRFARMIEARGVDIVQADPRTCGGITEWLNIAAFASAYHLPMAPHGNVYAGSNCIATVANALIAEYRLGLEQDHSNDLYDPPVVKDGQITLSAEPGPGVPWRENLITRQLASSA
jgi:D-arabinonate dehydratase